MWGTQNLPSITRDRGNFMWTHNLHKNMLYFMEGKFYVGSLKDIKFPSITKEGNFMLVYSQLASNPGSPFQIVSHFGEKLEQGRRAWKVSHVIWWYRDVESTRHKLCFGKTVTTAWNIQLAAVAALGEQQACTPGNSVILDVVLHLFPSDR